MSERHIFGGIVGNLTGLDKRKIAIYIKKKIEPKGTVGHDHVYEYVFRANLDILASGA